MRTEYLYELITLNEIGNFQAAADALFISQSTLSKHIQAMEQELGFALISHSRMGFSLTSEGADFLPYAVRICDIRNEYSSFFKDRRSKQVLNVGTCHFTPIEDELFSNAILRFSEEYPDCQIRTPPVMATSSIDEMLTDSERTSFSCVIAKSLSNDFSIESSYIKSRVIYSWPLCVLIRKGSPLERESLSLGDISGESLISMTYPTFANSLAVKAFRLEGHIPIFSDTLNSLRSICDFVKNGKGVYLVTEPVNASDLPDELALVKVSPQITSQTFVAYNKKFNHDHENYFIECLTREFTNGHKDPA